jgi:hypothetical protein
MKTTQPKPETPAAAPVATQPPAPAVEDWANDTPHETLYQLEMWQQETIESIDMTRREYIALKQHLAGLRGLIPAVAEPTAEPAAATQPKVDPMNVSLSDLSPEQEQEARAALLDRLQRQLAGMDTCNIREVARYADIQMADGYDPAGDFIEFLVMTHHMRSLTPNEAAFRLEEFRENFESAAKDARIFSAMYPEAVKSAAA